MTISLPSFPTIIVDVEEPVVIDAKFVYNFFVNDESVSEHGKKFISHGGIGEIVDPGLLSGENINEIPRFVKIMLEKISQQSDEIVSASEASALFLNSIKLIMDEDSFSSFGFIGVGLQDTAVDGKLKALTSASLQPLLKQALSAPKEKGVKFDENSTLFDIANALNSSTSDDIDSHFISDSMIQHETAGVTTNVFDKIKEIVFPVRINSQRIGTIIDNIINDPLTIYGDELVASQKNAQNVQNDAITAAGELVGATDELLYDPLIQFVKIEKKNAGFKHKRQHVGFILEKHDITNPDSIIKHESIIIASPSATIVYDPSIRYGALYSYAVKAVYLVTFETSDAASIEIENNDVYIATALISSRRSARIEIECIEKEEPAPPSDFSIIWDQTKDRPRLMWNFPVTKQRDIRRFQVFRRSTLIEPFELLREFDFDDSIVKFDSGENVIPQLIKKTKNPVLTFVDHEFIPAQTGDMIYALCSIDAHGLTSGYSQQIKISYARLGNKLLFDVVSRSGAPKMLPNIYVDRLPYVDSIQVTDVEQLNVSFDPDFLSVFSRIDLNGDSIKNELVESKVFLTNLDQSFYVMQTLNLDAQKIEQIKINIADRR